MAQIALHLSVYDISDKIERINTIIDNINVACEDIVEEITNVGLQLAIENDSYAPNTGNHNYDFVADAEGKKGYIAMEGQDSVYAEFGTGDVGANEPHPLHNSIPGINPYNSGSTIRIDDKGRHYWVYPPMENVGNYYYQGGLTYGIPAGCQMYNTLMELKELVPSISRKHLSQAIKRL